MITWAVAWFYVNLMRLASGEVIVQPVIFIMTGFFDVAMVVGVGFAIAVAIRGWPR